MPIVPAKDQTVIKKHGDDLATPMLLDGAVMNYDGYGLRTLNCSFKVTDNETSSTFKTSTIPEIGSEVVAGSGIYVSKVSKKYNRDLTITVDIEAVGIEGQAMQTNPCIEGAGTTSGEPIETHPNFKSKIGGTKANPLNGATFDEKRRFTGFAADAGPTAETSVQPFAGVRTYLSPKNIVRGYFHANKNSQPHSLFGAVGKQTTNGRIFDWLMYPQEYEAASAGSSFLLTACNIENICVNTAGNGVIYKVSYELMQGAKPNGWHRDIYDMVGGV